MLNIIEFTIRVRGEDGQVDTITRGHTLEEFLTRKNPIEYYSEEFKDALAKVTTLSGGIVRQNIEK